MLLKKESCSEVILMRGAAHRGKDSQREDMELSREDWQQAVGTPGTLNSVM